MPAQLRTRKHPRLKDREIYSQPGSTVHVIIGTHQNHPFFSDHNPAQAFKEILLSTAEEKKIRICAYCIMPDHIHILAQCSEGAGVIDFVRHAKGRFSVWCRRNQQRIRLQKSFYDHVLRKDEDIETVARYIIGNPVKAGLAERLGHYPFAGSVAQEP